MHTKLFSVAALATLALAQPLQHHAHNLKREAEADPAEVVVHVTRHLTKYVTAGEAAAAATPVAAALNQAAAVVSVANSPASSPAAQVSSSPAPAATGSSAAAQAPASTLKTSAAAASSTGSSSSSSSSSSQASANGISYSPYLNNGGCKSQSEVASDLAQLTDYNVVRIYGTDCNQVANVLSALGDNQKAFVGIFDMGSIPQELATIQSAIESNGKGWDVIHTISIGNELVNGGQATVDQVVSYTNQARGILKGYGYTGPVVAVDTFIAIIENPGLCAASDYIACNAHAYFDGTVTASQAGDWALEQIQRVWEACNGEKSVLISESGWPSQGDTNGVAVPSPANLKTAISSLQQKIGNDVILFSAFNDLWKAPGYLNVEQYWGILDV
ncbi:probable family 17 glucosidase Scw4p [Trichomonascus vanleenenianus]|uniref:putative family 17 glucosidase n=1 Tax=Trichomonascus vanleenenianus TaxID=2268995 RepID=UPI003ECB5759